MTINTFARRALVLTSMLFVSLAATHAATMAIYNKIEIENNTKEGSINYAIKALKEDFNRKFGSVDPLDRREPIALRFDIDPSVGGFDSYQITIGQRHICFKGSDELGLIHAIYHFSKCSLGIDPFIHFTALLPELEDEVELKREVINSKPYSYTHRGFFINDEDLIAGFQLEKIVYGFNLDFMERVFETMLRCEMTGVIPSTLVLPDEPHLALASDMGLYIMQHHAEPVGSVPLYWSKSEPYSWNTNKEAFVRFWSTAIERQKGRKVIWTLGFRGLLDRDFWEDDPSMDADCTDEQKAAVINEAVATQYELVRKITGESEPLVSANMRGEVNRLFEKGLIKYPPQTMIQFTDTGYGTFMPSTWRSIEQCKYPMGIYQHISYHSKKSHIRINVINPNNMCNEMVKAYDNNLTSICVLNVGNIKEKIFGIQQVVNYMNDTDSYRNHHNNEYYAWYVDNKYNSTSPVIAKVYQDFINNHFSLSAGGRPTGDEAFANYAEILLKLAYLNGAEFKPLLGLMPKEWAAQLAKLPAAKAKMHLASKLYLEQLEPCIDRWNSSMQRAYDAQSELSGNKLDFYRVDVMLPTKKLFHLTSMLAEMFKGVDSYLSGDYHSAQLYSYAALNHMEGALEVEQAIESANTGSFKDWYRFDTNARTTVTRDLIANFHALCIDMKQINMPNAYKNPKTPAIGQKKQPYFKSDYRGELHYMELAE